MKIKDLKQEHPAIYKRILECQVEQGNVANDELDLIKDHEHGNFSWSDTREYFNFWCDIDDGNYQTFYNKYPQTKRVPTYVVNGETYHYGEEVGVSDDGVEWHSRILAFVDNVNIFAVHTSYGTEFKEGGRYSVVSWKHIRKHLK